MTSRKCLLSLLGCILILITIGFIFRHRIDAGIGIIQARLAPAKTVENRVNEFGENVRARVEPLFRKNEIAYPPARLARKEFCAAGKRAGMDR